jgi:hypothetical protein
MSFRGFFNEKSIVFIDVISRFSGHSVRNDILGILQHPVNRDDHCYLFEIYDLLFVIFNTNIN